MMTTLRRNHPMLTKVTDPMKTLIPNPDGTISFSTKSAKVRLAGTGRLRPAVLLCAALFASMGTSLAMAQTNPAVPQTVIVADFNGDGIPDALVQSTVTPTATIAFGSVPYGTFGGNTKAVTFPAACTTLPAGSIAVGDFNGDGFSDIAFFCGTAAGTMLGNGDGTFGAPTTLVGIAASNGITGDFNKDGKIDIVVLDTVISGNSSSQEIRFASGKGDGTFNEPQVMTLAANTYTSIAAADLNADGFPELLLINSPADTARSLEVFGNNQDGTFGAGNQGQYSASTTATVSALGTTSIAAGNFFGATTTDVAVAGNGANGNVYVFQNTSTATAYSFNDPVTIPYANLSGMQAGKFTGSGFTDVAVSNGTNIAVLANDGKGNLAASYTSLSLASTSSNFVVADANGDGYADVYTATLPTTGALQLGVALTSGTATATSQPFSLAAGTHAIGAAWVGNVNFGGSNAAGSQIVVGVASVTTLASSKNPSLLTDSVTFTVHVGAGANSGSTQTPTGMVVLMDGTAMLASGAVDGTGAYTYTTTALAQGTHAITATYAGDALYATSNAMVSQVVNGATAVTVSSFTPNTANLGDGATTITVTGAGFVANSVVQVNGTAIATTLVNATTLKATIPASYFTTVGTLAITVFDPAPLNLTSAAVNFTVAAPAPIPVLDVPPTTAPGTQPTVTLSLTQPYPVDITATVTLNFAASTTPAIDDPNIVFESTGTRTENVTIPAGSVTVPPILLQAGTVAGTIMVPITLTAGGVNVTPTSLQPGVIVVPPSAPTISTATVTRSGKQLTVVMHGFSNTREMVNAKFHFTPATGATLDTTDLTVTADTIFNTNWFQTTPSDQYGSTFTYTQIFNTSDDATTVGSVEVTLTNTIGASEMMTAQ
jgi:hypothetical protein